MELTKILSIAGRPGLYQIISQSRGGVVVTSLIDGKKLAIGQTQRVSTLSDISIYTEEGDEPLANILKAFADRTEGKALELELNDSAALRAFFYEILPNHDEDRVYASDVKKIVKWYNLLIKNGITTFEMPAEESEENAEETKAAAARPGTSANATVPKKGPQPKTAKPKGAASKPITQKKSAK